MHAEEILRYVFVGAQHGESRLIIPCTPQVDGRETRTTLYGVRSTEYGLLDYETDNDMVVTITGEAKNRESATIEPHGRLDGMRRPDQTPSSRGFSCQIARESEAERRSRSRPPGHAVSGLAVRSTWDLSFHFGFLCG